MKKILYLILLIILNSSLYSQRFDFFKFPYGGDATNIQEAPDGSLYIGDYGLFKSTNNGDEWKKISDKSFYKIYFLKDNIMLGLVSADSIYYSLDNGLNWKFHSYFPFNLSVKANDEKVYFTNGELFVLDSISRPLRKINTVSKKVIEIEKYNYNNGLYIPNFLAFSDGSMAIKCVSRDTAKIGMGYLSIMYSVDKINWELLYASSTYESEIYGMYKDEKTFILYGAPGILYSTNSGKSFDTVNKTKKILEVFRVNYDLIAYTSTEILKSSDNGLSWSYISKLPKKMKTNRLFCTSKGTFFAVTNIGIYRSTDNGITWKDCNQGYNCTSFYGFGFNGDIVIAGGIDLYRSFNKGITWEKNKIDMHGFRNFQTDNKNNSYCLQRDFGYDNYPSKLLKSSNGGGDWTVLFDSALVEISGKRESYFVEDYVVFTNSQILLNAVSPAGRHLLINGFYYTSQGFVWNIIGALEFEKFYRNSDNELFVSGRQNIYRSKNNGFTWDTVAIMPSYYGYFNMAFNPHSKLGVAQGRYNYFTTDNGNTWDTVNTTDLANEHNLMIGWDRKDNLYALSTRSWYNNYQNLLISNDFGKTYSDYDSSFQDNLYVDYRGFFFSPEDDIFVTSYSGYYKSRNPISEVENGENFLGNDQELLLYPNPAESEIYLTGKTDIKPEIIGIYDYTGRNYLIKDQIIQKNENLLKINIAGLNNGLYYCIIRINNMTQIKPFIVSR